MGSVNSCCFGCSLAQGTIGAGIFCVIESLATIIRGALLLRQLKTWENDNGKHFDEETKYDEEVMKTVYRAYGCSYIVMGAVYFLLSILLFVAVSTQRRNYLLPWMIYTAIYFVLAIPNVFYNVASGVGDPVAIVGMVIGIAVTLYLYVVVSSYYKSLQATTTNPYDGTTNFCTSYPSQPGYIIQSPPMATGYTEESRIKSQPPSYPEANAGFPEYNAPYKDAYAQFQPPPSYAEAVNVERK